MIDRLIYTEKYREFQATFFLFFLLPVHIIRNSYKYIYIYIGCARLVGHPLRLILGQNIVGTPPKFFYFPQPYFAETFPEKRLKLYGKDNMIRSFWGQHSPRTEGYCQVVLYKQCLVEKGRLHKGEILKNGEQSSESR